MTDLTEDKPRHFLGRFALLGGRVSRRRRDLALLYLVLALPCALLFSAVTPMFDAADEGAHLFRAIQIGQGGLLASRHEGRLAGGDIPTTALQASSQINRYHEHRLRFDRATLAPYRALGWGGPDVTVPFANTAIYPPFFYAPSAAAIDIGRIAGFRVMTSFQLARIANAVTGAVLGSFAIALAEFGTPLLVAVLALPMTLSLFGSASQDAGLIGCAALAVALLTRQAAGLSGGWPSFVASGVLLGAIAAPRPPYAMLAAIPVLLTWRRSDRARGLASGAIAIAIAGTWLAGGVMPLSAATRAGGGLLTGAQIHWVARHPVGFLGVVLRSFVGDRWVRFREFVGVLGWLDIILKTSAYRVCKWALVIAALATVAGPAALAVPRLRIVLLLLLVLFGIEAALYLSWSTLGAPSVDGVQGRYFLPVALFASLLGRRPGPVAIDVALVVLAALVIFGDARALRPGLHRFPA